MRGSDLSVPRSTISYPSSPSSARTRSRSLTPRWSNATATFMKALRYSHAGRRALARAGSTAPGRLDPRSRGHELRPSDLVDVGRRPDGGSARRAPALRLRQGRRPAQRPPDLLERARLAAPLLDVQGGRRGHRGGVAHLPQVRQPTPG